ncbi:hypothetical protein, partial [Isoptericola hypogeus]|uniref:hypothetical protein n=1 Tax=Isoptericola hypogeus TaxID=300179 RepID=UPI0031E41DEB
WSVIAAVLAALTLGCVLWQILRFEATQPTFGWAVRFEPAREAVDGQRTVRVAFRPTGPVVIHEVEAIDWGHARIAVETERARMDCDSDELVAVATWRDGKEAYVGFTWLTPSLLMKKPIRQALRVDLRDGSLHRWRWHRLPRPRGRAQGRWIAWTPGQARRTHVPDLWGMPGSR